MLAGAAFGLYPNLLPASTDPSRSLTIHNAAANHFGLAVGMVWWSIGTALVICYFAYTYHRFRGRVEISDQATGAYSN
jgi:cytochrome d ubiquinol oxidase subunit II